MAFEISPKKETKKINWLDLIFYFSLILLLATVLSYFVLEYYITEANNQIETLNKKINEQKQKTQELKSSLMGKKELINDFSKVIDQHKLTYQAFNIIEKSTHPEVFFIDFYFDPNSFKISLSGITSNFRTLGEQILILKSKEMITSFNLTSISSGAEKEGVVETEGYIRFDLDISLSPQVFIFSSQSQ